MTKEEKIKEAYGEYWELVKEFVDKNGWCLTRKKINFSKLIKDISVVYRKDFNYSSYPFRPLCISGIENNNGWIKIESEDDLPKEKDSYWIVDKTGDIEKATYYGKDDLSIRIWRTQFTHYQPIQKPKPPIY